MTAGGTSLVVLGLALGVLATVLLFSLLVAQAMAEHRLRLQAANALLGIAVLLAAGGAPALSVVASVVLLAGAARQLRVLVSARPRREAGHRAQRQREAALYVAGACVALVQPETLVLGVAAWTVVQGRSLAQVWHRGFAWRFLCVVMVAGLALALASFHGGAWLPLGGASTRFALASGLLSLAVASGYLATVWCSRLEGETRARVAGLSLVDPLTGLSTPPVLTERVRAARVMRHRHGVRSVVLLVEIENLRDIAMRFGQPGAEVAVLSAAHRVRCSAPHKADVIARLGAGLFGVLVDGMDGVQATQQVATRIVAAGLRTTIPGLPEEALEFRVVQSDVPAVEECDDAQWLGALQACLAVERVTAPERHIARVGAEEILEQLGRARPHAAAGDDRPRAVPAFETA